jgi:hypothetical protein
MREREREDNALAGKLLLVPEGCKTKICPPADNKSD